MKLLENLKSKFKNPFNKQKGFIKKKEARVKAYVSKNPKAVMTCLLKPTMMKIKPRKSRMPLTWSEAKALKDLPPGRVKKAFVRGLERKYYGKQQEAA